MQVYTYECEKVEAKQEVFGQMRCVWLLAKHFCTMSMLPGGSMIIWATMAANWNGRTRIGGLFRST